MVAGKKGLCVGEELLMGYKIGFWNGIHRAQKWRDENPKVSARLDVELLVEAVRRDEQRRIPRVEVPPEKKKKIRKERMKSIHTWKMR